MGEDAANSSCKSARLVMVLFFCLIAFFCMFVCLIVFIMFNQLFLLVFFYLFFVFCCCCLFFFFFLKHIFIYIHSDDFPAVASQAIRLQALI